MPQGKTLIRVGFLLATVAAAPGARVERAAGPTATLRLESVSDFVSWPTPPLLAL